MAPIAAGRPRPGLPFRQSQRRRQDRTVALEQVCQRPGGRLDTHCVAVRRPGQRHVLDGAAEAEVHLTQVRVHRSEIAGGVGIDLDRVVGDAKEPRLGVVRVRREHRGGDERERSPFSGSGRPKSSRARTRLRSASGQAAPARRTACRRSRERRSRPPRREETGSGRTWLRSRGSPPVELIGDARRAGQRAVDASTCGASSSNPYVPIQRSSTGNRPMNGIARRKVSSYGMALLVKRSPRPNVDEGRAPLIGSLCRFA